MSVRAFAVGVAALVCAVPAAAQQRGTMELGGFGSVASFESSLTLNSAYGGGGRIGMFLAPRWSVEFEDAEMRASRPSGLRDVNVGVLSGRLVAVPIKTGALSILLGVGGGVSTETNFMHTYGVDALAGAKFALRQNLVLRVDGVWDWLANQNWKTYKSLRLGLSIYRNPAREVRTVTVVTPAPPPMVVAHEDSVSAAETRRLRARDAALQALRDSLANAPAVTPPPPPPVSEQRIPVSKESAAKMVSEIHFAAKDSVLTDPAKAILDEQIPVFNDNPTMTIVIGIDRNNRALGTRRAEAVKDYIVARGIAPGRVVIGGRQLSTVDHPVFRLLIAP